ncbi:hypothetical protein [Pseudoduganella buxea]|uniref:Uncharacterized protein n=1 Tax=Pseudoduganella buxea TaxID=1949069 RepID=A0A6I3T1L2_9BURK|nr:hypothetical protein [Pseudoduganella buxea]MTV53537.1 hypothetical protein [Pseudoduganella buxea]GGC22921.1 hypothetical protein GCM10011572_50510 [Pseudoduganella buxea]
MNTFNKDQMVSLTAQNEIDSAIRALTQAEPLRNIPAWNGAAYFGALVPTDEAFANLLDKLEELCDAATPGPWCAFETHVVARRTHSRRGFDMKIEGSNRSDNRKNAAFIAAANPIMVRHLITAYRRLSSVCGVDTDEANSRQRRHRDVTPPAKEHVTLTEITRSARSEASPLVIPPFLEHAKSRG